MKMAHLYQMSDLQSDCEDYLQQTVCKDNAVEVWKVAGITGCQKLRERALTVIAKVSCHSFFFKKKLYIQVQ